MNKILNLIDNKLKNYQLLPSMSESLFGQKIINENISVVTG